MEQNISVLGSQYESTREIDNLPSQKGNTSVNNASVQNRFMLFGTNRNHRAPTTCGGTTDCGNSVMNQK